MAKLAERLSGDHVSRYHVKVDDEMFVASGHQLKKAIEAEIEVPQKPHLGKSLWGMVVVVIGAVPSFPAYAPSDTLIWGLTGAHWQTLIVVIVLLCVGRLVWDLLGYKKANERFRRARGKPQAIMNRLRDHHPWGEDEPASGEPGGNA
ncbi:MAG: hypothetical protein IT285_13960 [Bdellovibrionales bacterium]|nr:hypothetical protein [Bdellovibrionales bacterium]